METPIIRCPRPECNHPINSHGEGLCLDCGCRMDPNLIAVAAVQTALVGELTPMPGHQHVVRQPDGSWS